MTLETFHEYTQRRCRTAATAAPDVNGECMTACPSVCCSSGSGGMEKESGEGEPAVSGKPPADPLLDAAGLFSEGRHKNSITEEHILVVFELVRVVLRCTLTVALFYYGVLVLTFWLHHQTLKITHGESTSQVNCDKLKHD
ncbi:hypothetical protein EVAR_50674_1 [Eumeta japonica]|uniref:Uncharacterized protein n=1 Tax=Eumeta variegata TaxID=151549 RepID=A0A4C1XPC1_EUMVA|nr:hypothetical protein EVAR_50674_1 [Eumeta japonica]